VDGLRHWRDTPRRELAERFPEQPMFVGGADVVGGPSAEQDAGDVQEGGVKRLGRDVRLGGLRDRPGQAIPRFERPGLAGLGRGPASLRPGELVGL